MSGQRSTVRGHVIPVRPIAGLVSTRQARRAFGSIKHVMRTRVILHCQDRGDTQAERERERERERG